MINNIGSSTYPPMMLQSMQKPMPPATDIAEDLLSAADTDSDGSISKAEFTALFESSESADNSSVNGLFSEMDTDGDESISLTEASDAVTNLLQQLQEQRIASDMPPPPPPPGVDELMALADEDEDGNLTLDEFSNALKLSEDEDESILADLFADTDINGDGIVSREELETTMDVNSNSNAQTNNRNADENKISMVVNSLLQQYQLNAEKLTTETSLSITA